MCIDLVEAAAPVAARLCVEATAPVAARLSSFHAHAIHCLLSLHPHAHRPFNKSAGEVADALGAVKGGIHCKSVAVTHMPPVLPDTRAKVRAWCGHNWTHLIN
jgi:hypothetical protein